MLEGKALIYQVLPRLWGKGHLSSINAGVLSYLRETLGISYVWYTGIIRHASGDLDWTKGNAGSPYAIEDYFDVNPYLADSPEDRLDEFKDLVKRTHAAGLKVIIDFVPNHLARNCSPFFGGKDDKTVHWKPENDFFYYPGQKLKLPIPSSWEEDPARATGNAFTPEPDINDWYETVKLNYCDFRTPTWDKMLQVLKYWTAMGVDGFRCDMVELIPREAVSFLIEEVRRDYPGTVFIAEVYNVDSYRYYVLDAGFDALYDKSGLYDCLYAIVKGYGSAKGITANWQRLGDIQPFMLNFLENHDEVRLAGDLFAGSAAKSYAALYVSLLFNTCPFMLYAGGEVGEKGPTSIFDWQHPEGLVQLANYISGVKSLPKESASILKRYISLLKYSQEDIIRFGSTYDLAYCNGSEDRHFAFLRSYKGESHLIYANFSSEDVDTKVFIPGEALSSGKDRTVSVKVKAYDGKIIKL